MVEHSVLFAFRNRKGDLALVPGVRCHCVRTPGQWRLLLHSRWTEKHPRDSSRAAAKMLRE